MNEQTNLSLNWNLELGTLNSIPLYHFSLRVQDELWRVPFSGQCWRFLAGRNETATWLLRGASLSL